MTNRHTSRNGHSTELEKEFIDWLGRGLHYDWSKHKKIPSRLELLRDYVIALKKRVNWGDVNKVEIHGYLANAIIEERRNV